MREYHARVAYCIPILVDASCAYDVSKRQTPEMVEKARIGFVMELVYLFATV